MNPPAARRRLCYVVSDPGSVRAFLAVHIRAAAAIHEVSVVARLPDPAVLADLDLPAHLLHVPIERPISPVRDLRALWLLWRLFRRHRFDLVHSVTPKAGLLAMLAARLAGIPWRIHTFTGQVWATRRGWRRAILKAADRVLAGLASDILVDSPSQRDFLVREGILEPGRGTVIGAGSICGVDAGRFRPDQALRAATRREFGIPDAARVLVFVGRLAREKGIADLLAAFGALAARHADLFLLLAGPDEEGQLAGAGLPAEVAGRIRHAGFTSRPEACMAAADVLCLPSYREGFGMVLIEAAAAGLPVVASRIYGITDAVVDGATGVLHAPGDRAALEAALAALLDDPDLRRAMGAAGRARALELFPAAAMAAGLVAFYGKMLR